MPRLLYVFPTPGTYTIQPNYRDKDDNELAIVSFPITVKPSPEKTTPYGLHLKCGVLLAGIVLGAVLVKQVSGIRNRV